MPILLNSVSRDDTQNCTFIYSANVGNDLKTGLSEGHRVTARFLGSYVPCLATVLELNGVDADYVAVKSGFENWAAGLGVPTSGWYSISSFDSTVNNAKAGTTGAWVQGVSSCDLGDQLSCNHPYSIASDQYYVGQSSASDIYARTVHEYTHVMQRAHGYVAQWLMEGGAVFMECVLGVLTANETIGSSPGDNYSTCIKTNLGIYGSSTSLPASYGYGTAPIAALQGTAPLSVH